jgi:hypothetical protein
MTKLTAVFSNFDFLSRVTHKSWSWLSDIAVVCPLKPSDRFWPQGDVVLTSQHNALPIWMYCKGEAEHCLLCFLKDCYRTSSWHSTFIAKQPTFSWFLQKGKPLLLIPVICVTWLPTLVPPSMTHRHVSPESHSYV